MALTVVVLLVGPAGSVHSSAERAQLTFDGTARVVIGRGAGSDVRLPDGSVSVRHASLRAQGADFVVIDEGSTNGTYVGSVRVDPRTSRIVRSGDRLRLGRVWLELRIDHASVTRDVAGATRDIALALVARALDSRGTDRTVKVEVVEGPDQGLELPLSEEGAPYLIGRGPHCELPLADADASREHVRLERRASKVWLRDLGIKNGTWLGGSSLPAQKDVLWRPTHMVRVGRSVLALVEPLSVALAAIERAADEKIDPAEAAPVAPGDSAAPAHAPPEASRAEPRPTDRPADGAASAHVVDRMRSQTGAGWSLTDALVMGAALCVLALSLAGLVWLLRS